MHILEKVEEEKDPSVFFHPTLKSSKHAAKCVARVNSLLGIIMRRFSEIDKDILMYLSKSVKTLVRPCLECASCVIVP